ncbi:MAG: hypothetical protein COA78_35125 [Blastopirellula sp.]|nr:MAG: hypothetical protein COA78_35125 [Blastopirellula sp.]
MKKDSVQGEFKDSTLGTFAVAAVLCVVCSVLVSVTAVGLKEIQDANIELDKQKNVLSSAGLLPKKATASDVASLFENVTVLAIDLATGEAVDSSVVKDPKEFDPFDEINDPGKRIEILFYAKSLVHANQEKEAATETGEKAEATVEEEELTEEQQLEKQLEAIKAIKLTPIDNADLRLGSIPFRAKYAVVYLIKKDGKLDQVVLPFYGKGLWSTLKGFISIDSNTQTIRGLTYYSHLETPGLGGEVDNEDWKAKWPGKQGIDAEGNVVITVPKAGTGNLSEDTVVDGLSGATITTKGINTMVRYWLGPAGFGPFLDKVRKGEIDG